LAERPVNGNDDDVLPVPPQMCYLKGRHCIHWFRRRFCHVSWRIQPIVPMVNVDSISPYCLFSITGRPLAPSKWTLWSTFRPMRITSLLVVAAVALACSDRANNQASSESGGTLVISTTG